MLCGSECSAVDRRNKQNMIVAEMRILRSMSGVTIEDRMKNECIRGIIGVTSAVNKIRE